MLKYRCIAVAGAMYSFNGVSVSAARAMRSCPTRASRRSSVAGVCSPARPKA